MWCAKKPKVQHKKTQKNTSQPKDLINNATFANHKSHQNKVKVISTDRRGPDRP